MLERSDSLADEAFFRKNRPSRPTASGHWLLVEIIQTALADSSNAPSAEFHTTKAAP